LYYDLSAKTTLLTTAMTPIHKQSLLRNLRSFPTVFDGRNRTADLYVPQNISKPLPVVLMLHGAGGDSIKAAQQTRWCDYAERENFIALFPNGLAIDPSRKSSFLRNPQVWNSGVERGAAYSPIADDIGYIDSLLNTLSTTYSIDEKKIFAAGFSNGGGMTWRLALQLSRRFAAIAPICTYNSIPEPWTQEEPVSAIVINCLDDPFIPIEGGPVKDIWSRSEIQRPSVVAAVEQYAEMMNCRLQREECINSEVKLRAYRSKALNPSVDFYTIANAGHAYPGGPHLLSERIAGKPTDAMDATAVIWKFFSQIIENPTV
jgi:polyhydroxybutyrate depolymerase